MQLLAIDQGNTRTKFALFRDGAPRQTWTCATAKMATAAELASAAFHVESVPAGIRVGLSTVVPELRAAWEQAAALNGHPLTVLTGTSPTPLTNAYATPETLGPDRLLAAVAAAHAAGTPVISISLGTATVVDAVDAEGRYLGGMIAAGIGLASDLLAGAASALYPVAWHEPHEAIGHTSEESLSNGWFYQSVGGLRAMVHATREALAANAPLVLTGGWAERLAPYLDDVALIDELLVLHGIARVLQEQGE